MLLEVTFCALVAGAPSTDCETAKFPLLAEVTPQQCVLLAQEVIAKESTGVWQGYSAQKYRCVQNRKDTASQ